MPESVTVPNSALWTFGRPTGSALPQFRGYLYLEELRYRNNKRQAFANLSKNYIDSVRAGRPMQLLIHGVENAGRSVLKGSRRRNIGLCRIQVPCRIPSSKRKL